MLTGSSPDYAHGLAERPTIRPAAAFHYDKEVLAQCQRYLQERNHHGLALIARQKGIPPFMRFKVWPILLKHHPFVAAPFIQPDLDKEKDKDSGDLSRRIRKDVRRYVRLAFSAADEPLDQTELQMFDVIERAVLRFVTKWGQIVRYDAALTWMALALAEWVPPLPNTPYVLLGRGAAQCVGSVFTDYDTYIDAQPGLREFLTEMVADESICTLQFGEVYERMALVALHSPEGSRLDRATLPTHGGTIEERVLFFIYVMQRLLPELLSYFQEEQLLNRFGRADDEWLIWWLKYCGAKVWSRVDRARVWDRMVGWRKASRSAEKLLSDASDLGPDVFWLVGGMQLNKDDSFRDLIHDLHGALPEPSDLVGLLPATLASSTSRTVPYATLDPHMELLFVSLALLKAKESTLVELDQHEIRTFLLRLPAKLYGVSDRYKQYQEDKGKPDYVFTYDYMDSIIAEAGELWRKWLWCEMNGDS